MTTNDKNDNRLRINVSEIGDSVELALMLQKPTLFEGLSGIGKTEVLKAFVGKWLEKNPTWAGKFFQLQAFEFSDFTGIPVERRDDEGAFVEFIQTQLTRICKPTIIIIDDITQASLDVQRVLLGLTQANKVIGFTEIAHPVVVLGTANDNSLDDLAMVNEMQSALASRWSGGRVVVEASKKDMVKYFAEKYGAENLFVRYLQSANCSLAENMECNHELKIRPVPRILEGAAQAVGKFDSNDMDRMRRVVAQICGRAIAIEFYEFLLSIRKIDSKEFFKKNSKDIKEFAKEKNAETVQVIINAIKGITPMLYEYDAAKIEICFSYIGMLAKAEHGECANILKTTIIEAFMNRGDKGKPFAEVMAKNPELIRDVIAQRMASK